MPKYTVLLSDDNTGLFQTLTEIAYEEDVELVCYQDWESTKVKLMDDFEAYHAVILDGKGKLNDSTKDADPKHLSNAVKWLAEENAKGRYIPAVVFTGFYDAISDFQEANDQILKIFSKGENTNSSFKEVLSFLKKAIKNSPEQKFKSSFPEAYHYSVKYFSKNNKDLLQALYNSVSDPVKSFEWKKSALDKLRYLNEALVDSIPQHYYEPEYELRDFIDKVKREGNAKATLGNRAVSIIDYFHNHEVQVPGPVLNCIKNLYYTASSYSSHSDEKQTDYYPSSEMILGLVYSHFGCYHWFTQIIKD